MTTTLIVQHDEDLVAARRRAMQGAFASMLADPNALVGSHWHYQMRLNHLQIRNVDLFGLYDAEIIRADAFAEAVAAAPPPVPIPVGEASDSGYSSLDEAPE